MTGRELAWRVLAQELRACTEVETGTGEKAPSYVISPLGGRMNRVLLVGTVSAAERVGADPNSGVWRTGLTDPTGTVPLTAGVFHPHAQADLQKLSGPALAMVIGKPSLFRGTDTTPVVSVRVEALRTVPDVAYRQLQAEAATQTLQRLDLVLRLRAPNAPTELDPASARLSPAWLRGARSSVPRYPTFDPAPYLESLRAVLIAVQAAPSEEAVRPVAPRSPAPAVEVVRVVHAQEPPRTPRLSPGLKALEGRLLEILDELSEGSPDGYADMDDLAERAARHGLDGERVEELLNFLSENGTVEEPLVGKFRRADGPPRE